MGDALIIDACRTPRGIGKGRKGALSGIHPQQLGATVLRALASAPASTPPMSTTSSWGTAAQLGPQSGDLGRMSALDAGTTSRASGVTLDRFFAARAHQRRHPFRYRRPIDLIDRGVR